MNLGNLAGSRPRTFGGRRPRRSRSCCRQRVGPGSLRVVVGKRAPETIDRDFAFAGDRELDEQIAAYRAEHERQHGQRLAMHARRSLGAGKVRVTFRIVAPAGGRR